MSDNNKSNNIKYLALSVVIVVGYFIYTSSTNDEIKKRPDISISESKSYTEEIDAKSKSALDQIIEDDLDSNKTKKSNNKKMITLSQANKDLIQNNRSKAKLSLASIYTAQQAFMGDFGRYSSDIVLMGFSPNSEVLSSVFGFLSPTYFDKQIEEENPENISSNYFIENDLKTSIRYVYSKEASKINLSDYRKYCKQECKVTKDSFEFMVVIPYVGVEGVDVYLMNEKKELHIVHQDRAQ